MAVEGFRLAPRAVSRMAEPHELSKIVQDDTAVQLGPAMLTRAKPVRHFPHSCRRQVGCDLQQDLEPAAVDTFADPHEVILPHDEEAGHRIAQSNAQASLCQPGGAKRLEAAKQRPPDGAPARHVAAADHCGGATLQLRHHLRQDGGVVLQVAVDAGHGVPGSCGKAVHDREAKAVLLEAPQKTKLGDAAGELFDTPRRLMLGIIIDDEDFVWQGGEHLGEAPHQGLDVFDFVEGWGNHAQPTYSPGAEVRILVENCVRQWFHAMSPIANLVPVW